MKGVIISAQSVQSLKLNWIYTDAEQWRYSTNTLTYGVRSTQEKKLMDYQLIKIGPLKTDQIC